VQNSRGKIILINNTCLIPPIQLYEEVLKENQLLKSKLSRGEEDMAELKLKIDKLSMVSMFNCHQLMTFKNL